MKKLRCRETESLIRSREESGFIPKQLYPAASAMGERNISIISKKCSPLWPMSFLGCRLSRGILAWEMHSRPLKLYKNHLYTLLLTVGESRSETNRIKFFSSSLALMGLCQELRVPWHVCLSRTTTLLPCSSPPPPPARGPHTPCFLVPPCLWQVLLSYSFPLCLLLKHLHPKASEDEKCACQLTLGSQNA